VMASTSVLRIKIVPWDDQALDMLRNGSVA
jgi:hypothetical protein